MNPLSRRPCRPSRGDCFCSGFVFLLFLLASPTTSLADKVTSLPVVESTTETRIHQWPQQTLLLHDDLSASMLQSSSSLSLRHNDPQNDDKDFHRRSLTETTRTTSSNDAPSLICQLHLNRILPNDGRVVASNEDDEENRQFSTCSPWHAASATTTGAYLVHPPAWILERHAHILVRGVALYLVIPGGYTSSTENDQIIIPNPETVTVLLDPPPSPQPQHKKNRHLQRVEGAKKTVMLRIRGRDAEPDFSVQQLYSFLLTHEMSARRQLERCSQGLVTLDASRYGILDVPLLDTDIQGLKNLQVMNLAETYVNEVILAKDTAVDNIREWADLLIFVLPPGTGNWAAFATVSGKQSVFNNRWGGYLGALLHELGHNLGLDHAFEDGVEYGGETGFMGNVPQEVYEPQRCYNAHNHYSLGWFHDRVIEVDPEVPQLVTLAPFVHYQYTAPSEYIIVRIGDLYMQYNRATEYNSQSGQYRDQLVIVRDRAIERGTDLLVGLDVREDYKEGNRQEEITVHVCNRFYQGGVYGADILTVSVGYGNSLCNYNNNNASPPRPAPVPAPMPVPVPNQTPPEPSVPEQTLAPVVPQSPPVPSPGPPSRPTPSTPTNPSSSKPPAVPPMNNPSPPTYNGVSTASPTNNGVSTASPTIVVGDSVDNGGWTGIEQEEQKDRADGSSELIGILSSILCFLAAVAVIFIGYLKLTERYRRRRKQPAPSTYTEKDLEEAEKASVHSADSDTTASSEESFATEHAVSPSSRLYLRIPFLSSGHSMAQSIATSCALAGTVDEDADIAVVGLKDRFRRAPDRTVEHREAQTTQTSTSDHDAVGHCGMLSETGDTVALTPVQSVSHSFADWMGMSTRWMMQSSDRASTATCDMLTNICGYGNSAGSVVAGSTQAKNVLL